MHDLNPFVFGRPVDELIDRENELERIRDLAEGGHFVRLTAPRRYGKTSLLHRLAADAERDLGMTSIAVDFSRVLSLADVAIRVEDGYRRATDGPLKRVIRQLGRSWNVGVTFGAGGLAAKIQADPKTDPLPALHRLLDLPREVFERTGHQVLVTFDEFQEVLRLERSGIDGIIRSHIQHHGDAASYVFAGSEPGMMETLFGERERPLFGQAVPVSLPPLPDDALGAAIDERFGRTGRDAGEALDALLQFVEGHPQRAMLLAHYIWQQTPRGDTATISTYGAALDEVLDMLADGFDRLVDGLADNQIRVLFAVALSPRSLNSQYTQRRFGLPRGGAAGKALTALIRRGEVLGGAHPRITDPFLRHWLRQRRMPPSPDGDAE